MKLTTVRLPKYLNLENWWYTIPSAISIVRIKINNPVMKRFFSGQLVPPTTFYTVNLSADSSSVANNLDMLTLSKLQKILSLEFQDIYGNKLQNVDTILSLFNQCKGYIQANYFDDNGTLMMKPPPEYTPDDDDYSSFFDDELDGDDFEELDSAVDAAYNANASTNTNSDMIMDVNECALSEDNIECPLLIRTYCMLDKIHYNTEIRGIPFGPINIRPSFIKYVAEDKPIERYTGSSINDSIDMDLGLFTMLFNTCKSYIATKNHVQNLSMGSVFKKSSYCQPAK